MEEGIKSKKYLHIKSAARTLFWKHGIRRVSIEEICREAGVSKMTFYRFFEDKNDLARCILSDIFEESMKTYRQLMDSDLSFEEKVRRQVLAKFEGTRDISPELIRDIFADPRLELKEFMEEHTDRFTRMVVQDYEYAQKMGWMRKDIRLDFILYFTKKMTEIASDPQLISMYGNMQDLIMEMTRLFFYGILPHEQKQHD